MGNIENRVARNHIVHIIDYSALRNHQSGTSLALKILRREDSSSLSKNAALFVRAREAIKLGSSRRIGLERPLTLFEKTNLDITGLSREQAALMTSDELELLANRIMDRSKNFLGS